MAIDLKEIWTKTAASSQNKKDKVNFFRQGMSVRNSIFNIFCRFDFEVTTSVQKYVLTLHATFFSSKAFITLIMNLKLFALEEERRSPWHFFFSLSYDWFVFDYTLQSMMMVHKKWAEKLVKTQSRSKVQILNCSSFKGTFSIKILPFTLNSNHSS